MPTEKLKQGRAVTLEEGEKVIGKVVPADEMGECYDVNNPLPVQAQDGQKVQLVDADGEQIESLSIKPHLQTTRKGWQPPAGSDEGAAYVVNKPVLKTYTTTGAGAISKQTTLRTDYPDREWILKRITVTWSAAPTTSESLTVTQNPSTKIANRPSTVLYSVNPATNSLTSLVHEWDNGGQRHESGDEVTLAYTNTDTRTVTAEIVVEVL